MAEINLRELLNDSIGATEMHLKVVRKASRSGLPESRALQIIEDLKDVVQGMNITLAKLGVLRDQLFGRLGSKKQRYVIEFLYCDNNQGYLDHVELTLAEARKVNAALLKLVEEDVIEDVGGNDGFCPIMYPYQPADRFRSFAELRKCWNEGGGTMEGRL